MQSIRMISFIRNAYQNYINNVLATARRNVAKADAAAMVARDEQRAIHNALFGDLPK